MLSKNDSFYNKIINLFESNYSIKCMIDESTMTPIFTFTSKLTKESFNYKISATDIQDFMCGSKIESINNMFSILTENMREEKLNILGI